MKNLQRGQQDVCEHGLFEAREEQARVGAQVLDESVRCVAILCAKGSWF